MQEFLVGEFIRRKRIERGLTQEELCEGICDPITISRIENLKQPPARFTVDALLQRLDVSDGRYFFYIQGGSCDDSEEEIEREREIRTLQDSIARFCEADGEVTVPERQAALKMQGELERLTDFGNPIERQRLLLIKAKVSEKLGGQALERIGLLEEAISLTVPQFHEEKLRCKVYGYDEMDMIRRLGLACSEDGQAERAAGLLSQLYDYVTAHATDFARSAKVIAPIAHSYGVVLRRDGRLLQALDVAQCGIQSSLFAYEGKIVDLLELEVECLMLSGSVEQGKERALEASTLRAVIKKFLGLSAEEGAEDLNQTILFELSCGRYKNMHLGKVIKCVREGRGFGQKQLCQGLCTTATLSRFENGEQSPSWDCVRSMLERLGMAWEDYTAILHSDEIYLSNMRRDIMKLSVTLPREKEEKRKEIQAAVLKMLGDMEAGIKKTDTINRQFIMHQRALIAYETHACDLNDKLEQLILALHMTLPDLAFEEINRFLYSDEEFMLLINIADTYHTLGQVRQAFYIYEQIYRVLKKTYYHHDLMILFTQNYAIDLSDEKAYEDAIHVAENGIATAIERKQYAMLPILLHTQAECFYLLGETEKCREYYAYIAPLYRLFGDHRNLKILATDAEERFHIQF